MFKTRKKHKMEKLNLIPILDAIFIFIFFLLMSAQFVDIYEIGSKVPMTSTSSPQKDKKEPLNLKLALKKNIVIVSTGVSNIQNKEFKKDENEELKQYIKELKAKNPNEKTALIAPSTNYPFEKIIVYIDIAKGTKGEYFNEIVFETME